MQHTLQAMKELYIIICCIYVYSTLISSFVPLCWCPLWLLQRRLSVCCFCWHHWHVFWAAVPSGLLLLRLLNLLLPLSRCCLAEGLLLWRTGQGVNIYEGLFRWQRCRRHKFISKHLQRELKVSAPFPLHHPSITIACLCCLQNFFRRCCVWLRPVAAFASAPAAAAATCHI